MTDAPYSWLSPHYDRLMGHVLYGSWADSVQKILKRKKKAPKRLLELGAGTCRLAGELNIPSLEYRVHTDLSLSMLQAAGKEVGFPRVACDATAIPFAPGFDFVLMCYDAVNYLNPRQLRELFDEVHRVLEPNGIFLFDITTEENSIEWFEDYSDAFDTGEGLLVRRSAYNKEQRIQHNYFDYFTPAENGLFKRRQEHHEQYIYPVPDLCEWLGECGFQLLDLLDALTLRPATSKSERIQILVAAE